MENVHELSKDPKFINWLKSIFVLNCFQKLLKPFSNEEIGKLHGDLAIKCGPDHCVNECDFTSWNPQLNQIPPLGCDLCSRWRDVILTNHTSPHGKVMWLNSKPHLWSREKWEVAKVYMPGGHKKHNSVGDFDIAALLCLMNQCKHFKKFELGGLCEKVSKVRNDIMHAPMYQVEQKDLHDYVSQIRELGKKLARHDPEFKSLSEDIDEIQNHDFISILPDDIEAQKNRAKDVKEQEDILVAFAQEAADHHVTRMELEKLKRQIVLQEQNYLSAVNDVLAAVQQFQAPLMTNLRSLQQKVFKQHQGSELEKEAIALIDQAEDTFASFSTTYRQDSVIKQNLNFVESEEDSVEYKACMVKKGRK